MNTNAVSNLARAPTAAVSSVSGWWPAPVEMRDPDYFPNAYCVKYNEDKYSYAVSVNHSMWSVWNTPLEQPSVLGEAARLAWHPRRRATIC